jgi:5'-deoxynucleotidase YfbR-like HD superfamily hydrolase
MSSTIEKIRYIFSGGNVRRYHTVDIIKEETVAHHSHVVACLVIELGGDLSTVKKALYHDLYEQTSGDLPSTLKASGFNSAQLNFMEEESNDYYGLNPVDYDYRILKIADILSGVLKCSNEVKMGNCKCSVPRENYKSYLDKMAPFSESENRVIEAVYKV